MTVVAVYHYGPLSNKNRSYTGNKTRIWFDKDGWCHYESSSHSFSVGDKGEKGKNGSLSKNVCERLLEGDLDWKEVDIDWNNVAESYKEQKNKREQEIQKSQSLPENSDQQFLLFGVWN